jgi:hypothetical protein
MTTEQRDALIREINDTVGHLGFKAWWTEPWNSIYVHYGDAEQFPVIARFVGGGFRGSPWGIWTYPPRACPDDMKDWFEALRVAMSGPRLYDEAECRRYDLDPFTAAITLNNLNQLTYETKDIPTQLR